MAAPQEPLPLSAAERQLIQDLRGLPDEALRARMLHSIQHLLFFFQNPRCQGVGVEGFPCGEPRASCDECHQIWDLLDRLSAHPKQDCY